MSTAPCPNCEKIIEWTSKNPYRPFCCHRCQLIDLGKWASESHCIKGEPADPDEMNSPNQHE